MVDGRVVFGGMDGNLYVLDSRSGAVIKSINLGGRVLSTPCVVDGEIFIGTATGRFYCLR